MKTDDFDYYLPEELIAQHPLENRSSSRLMVLDKQTGEIKHQHFYDIVDLIDNDSVLVLNDTKVYPARLIGEKEDTKAVIEVLLLEDLGGNRFKCLAKPQRRVHVGNIISFGDGKLKAKCLSLEDDGVTYFELIYEGILIEKLEELGEMPLPPYIHEKLENHDRYNTVYAKNLGSAAAPTAGLHFTNEILTKLEKKGVEIIRVTLHVGLGTFRPVSVEDVTKHKMHEEYYEISEYAASRLNEAKKNGKKIICVGTTSVRTLESAYDNGFKACKARTSIFIYPGFEFKVVDKLITNFHLPKSTLIMLVSALATKENIMHAYEEAVKEKYRFFSFGDAMFIK